MSMNITCILVVIGFALTIGSALGKVPLWVATLFLAIAMLLGCLPR